MIPPRQLEFFIRALAARKHTKDLLIIRHHFSKHAATVRLIDVAKKVKIQRLRLGTDPTTKPAADGKIKKPRAAKTPAHIVAANAQAVLSRYAKPSYRVIRHRGSARLLRGGRGADG